MKKALITFISISSVVLFGIGYVANAAPTSTIVQNLIITGVKSAPCLTTDGNGLVGSVGCGAGGGSTYPSSSIFVLSGGLLTGGGDLTASRTITLASSTIWNLFSAAGTGLTYNSSTGQYTWTNPGYILSAPATSTITASGTTLTGPSFTFSSSTTILVRASGTALYWDLVNTGNWLGTWQGVNSTTFYLASNPSSFISSVTINGQSGTSFSGLSTSTILITTSTGAGTFTVTSSGNKTFNITFPPSGDQYFAPSTTIPTSFVSSFQAATGTVVAATSGPLFADITQSGHTVTFKSISTSTLSGAQYLNLSQYLTAALTSLQGLTGPSLTLASSGPLISDITGSGSTITITTIPTSTILAGYATSSVASTTPWTIGGITIVSSSKAITSVPTTTIYVSSTQVLVPFLTDGAGTKYSTSTASSLAGPYLGVSSTLLTVSSTLASTTLSVVIPNPTSTLPYKYEGQVYLSQLFTIQQIRCNEWATGASTTISVFRAKELNTSTIDSAVVSSLTCGNLTTSTTSFTTSTITAGTVLMVAVTSTALSPTQVSIQIIGTKQ